MPERATVNDSPYLFVTFEKNGAIGSISVFHALKADVRQAIKARAMIVGAAKYQAFSISQNSDKTLAFERI